MSYSEFSSTETQTIQTILFVQQIESAVELAGGNCAIIYISSYNVFKLALTALVGDTIVTKSMWIHIEKNAWSPEYIVSCFGKSTSFSKHKEYFCILNHVPDFQTWPTY